MTLNPHLFLLQSFTTDPFNNNTFTPKKHLVLLDQDQSEVLYHLITPMSETFGSFASMMRPVSEEYYAQFRTPPQAAPPTTTTAARRSALPTTPAAAQPSLPRPTPQARGFHAPLTQDERDELRRLGLCMYCGGSDHVVANVRKLLLCHSLTSLSHGPEELFEL